MLTSLGLSRGSAQTPDAKPAPHATSLPQASSILLKPGPHLFLD